MSELFEALTERVRSRPATPLVTWYGPDGARSELSTVTFATAAAKTAGALLDDWDIEPGALVRLDLPLHWQLPVWLAACDLAGLVVTLDDSPADVVVADTVEALSADPAPHLVVTSTTAFGLPGVPPPAPMLDHARDAMGQPDVYLGPPGDGRWRVDGSDWSPASIAAHATALAADTPLGVADRVLVTSATDPLTRSLAVWPLPVLTGAAVVLCPIEVGTDLEAREHVTLRVG